MARFKRGNLDQGEFLSINFQDQYTEYSTESMLKKFVEENIDMRAFEKYYKNEFYGRTGKHPKDIIAAIIYGYINGIRSSRKIEKYLQTHIGFMYVSNRLSIDHSKLCDFKIQFRKEMEELTTIVLYGLNNLGEIDWDLVVGDGTKIKANASKSKTMNKEKAAKILRTYRKMAEKIIKRDMENDERNARGEMEPEKYLAEKKRIERQKKLYENTIEAVETYKKLIESGELKDGDKTLTGNEHYNLSDPDSSLTLGADKSGYIQGYNMKMMVSNNDIILSCENDKLNEKYSAKPMIEGIEALKKELGVEKETKYLLDSGFQNMPDILDLEAKGLKCYIDVKEEDFSDVRQKRKNFKIFQDDSGGFQLKCAGGQIGKRYLDRKNKKIYFFYYRSHCKGCKKYRECYEKIRPDRNQKTINYNLFELDNRAGIDRYLTHLRSEDGQKIYARRIGKEHVFSNTKTQRNYHQTFYRGTDKVRFDWKMNALSHNLGKYFQALVKNAMKL